MTFKIKLDSREIDYFCNALNRSIKSKVTIGNDIKMLDAKSLLSLLTLDFNETHEIEIYTENDSEIELFKDLLRRYGGVE